ncbi:MAG: hypothetical protein NTU63_01690 [Candidatus Pacearchaeota archaeon]|nr:hypothetical protein [Candidatus Pacearchaeota archaeon]
MEENITSEIEAKGLVLQDEIEARKKNLIGFLKKRTEWIYYGILTFILFINTYIRTRNIPLLKDVSTGTWTLGPDLDPFLFLRWAKYIAEYGKLFALDAMRSVPLIDLCSGASCSAIDTSAEMKTLSYMIAWLYKFLFVFNKEATVTYAAIIFPVIMSVLAGIAFFLFARKLFYKENKLVANVIALVATAFFVLVPSILPRTIAGIPEKESAAFFFMFAAFYLFLEAYSSEKLVKGTIYGVLAGIMTGLLGLTWGGVIFVFLAIGGAVLFAFLLGKIDKKKSLFYLSWIVGALMIMLPFSARYRYLSLVYSASTGLAFMVLFILAVDFLIFKKNIFKIKEKIKIKLPEPVISFIITGIFLVIIASITIGISFVPDIFKDIISHTVNPMVQSRFSVTVAENRQPYFINEWRSEFGPIALNIPLFFWLFFIGSIFLFGYMVKSLTKKEKIILIISYALFLAGLIFSKYSSSSQLNGSNTLSFIVYFGGTLLFILCFIYFYYKEYKSGRFSFFKEFDFSYILYFIILTMMIVAARGAVRLTMVLAAVSPIAVAFLIVKTFQKYLQEKEETKKLFLAIVVILILIASCFTLWTYYNSDKSIAGSFGPGPYQWQWQNAMNWVREFTDKTAVFAHWWDYGYWVQSIGERATILDGGNAVGYWNHLMGRHILTGTDERTALEFLYAHNATHLLIDSSDIGKYGAFSSIGSDENYDRFSFISTFFMDEKQTQETNNETIYVYPIGIALDEDVIINETTENSTSINQVVLPRKKTAVAAVVIKQSEGKILQPLVFFVYNGKQYQRPMKVLYIGNKLYEFDSGLDVGIFIFPKIEQDSNGQLKILDKGAAFYLSERVVNSRLARLYLFGQETEYFQLAHSENSELVKSLRQQIPELGEFVYYQDFSGPIKIWEISYPSDITLNPDYLRMDYPNVEYAMVKSNEYM